MGTIGTASNEVNPSARNSSSTPSRWSGWMSMKARFGRSPGPSTLRSRSRLCWTRKRVLSRNAPKPSESTTVTVWFAGR